MQKTALVNSPIVPDHFFPGHPHSPGNERYKVEQTITKTLLVMKLTLMLIVTSFFTVHASSNAQIVSISVKDLPLAEVFTIIKKQTGFVIFNNRRDMADAKPVTLSVTNVPLHEALALLLKDQPLDYTIRDKTIALFRKSPSFSLPFPAADESKPVAAPIRIRVTDSAGVPLHGATVALRNTKNAGVTDSKGVIQITVDEGDVLQISFLGYETQMLRITRVILNNSGVTEIRLQSTASKLNLVEVVVNTGYANIQRHHLTGSVTTLKMDDIKVAGFNTIDRMLEGRVPGMIYMQNSGQVGAAPKLRIRGSSTILGNREPLWVLDGIVLSDPVNIDPARINDLDFVNLLGNAISGLNPDDIDQIDVLKDAAATALYGTRAANGVIVITTKKGKEGPPSLSYSVTGTYARRPRYTDKAINLMNSAERIDVSREMMERGMYYPDVSEWVGYEAAIQDYYNGKLTYEQFKEAINFYEAGNTDWLGIIGRDALSNNHTLSLSGGSASVKYYGSLGMTNEVGNIKDEGSKRYSALLNLTANYRKLSTRLSLTANTSSREYNPTDLGLLDYAYKTSRAVPGYKTDGSPWYYRRSNGYNYYDFNVLNEMANSGETTKQSTVMLNQQVSYKIMKNWNVDGILSYTVSNTNQETYFTANTFYIYSLRGDRSSFGDLAPVGGELRTNNVRNTSWMARIQSNFQHTFGPTNDHLFTTSAGFEVRSEEYDGFRINRRGYERDRGKTFSTIPTSASGYYAIYMGSAEAQGIITDQLKNEMGWYVMGGYGYKNSLLFNVHMRTEASNLFGQQTNGRFLPIWAVSARWNMKQNLLKNIPWFSDGALRASWGYQGNMLPMQTPNMIIRKSTLNTFFNEFTSTVQNFPNPDLKWEKTASTNITLDFSLFNNKINGSVSYYYRRTTDAFLSKSVSEINGIKTYVVNQGVLENKGVELSFNFTPINNAGLNGKSKGFVWRVDPQLGQVLNRLVNTAVNNRNNILRDRVTYQDMLAGNVEIAGKPLNTFYSYQFKGLNPANGSPMFFGAESELSSDLKTKYAAMNAQDVFLLVMTESGRKEPFIQGGISNYFGYRNFSLSFNFAYSFGNKIRLLKLTSGYGTPTPYPQDNLRKEYVYRWRKPGDELYTNIPSLIPGPVSAGDWWTSQPYSFAGNVYQMYDNSDIRVVKGDFVKLQSISFRYNLDNKLCKALYARSAYVSLTGANLFTIADKALKGQDPIQSGATPNVNLSPRPAYSFNINVSF